MKNDQMNSLRMSQLQNSKVQNDRVKKGENARRNENALKNGDLKDSYFENLLNNKLGKKKACK